MSVSALQAFQASTVTYVVPVTVLAGLLILWQVQSQVGLTK